MASIHYGILGAPTGRVGPVTGYVRNGKSILRVAKNQGEVKVTPARAAQRARLKACNTFADAFRGTGFFHITFPAYGAKGTGYNRAMSSLMHLAVTGIFPDISLAWDQVLVARGPLPKPANTAVVGTDDGKLHFSWGDNSHDGTASAGDKAILVAYAPSVNKAIFDLDGGSRQAGSGLLDVAGLNGEEMATWMAFVNDAGDVSDSVFCGFPAVGTP